jgi:LAS superfamily LD-carboxypeptidase LdcB
MADQETETTIPAGVVTSSETPKFDVLKQYSTSYAQQSFESVNAVPAPKKPDRAVIQLPQLMESQETAYKNNNAYAITCCRVQGHLVEKNTAYDFLLMANAAAKDGITLRINSGFRTYEAQKKIWTDRQNPLVEKAKGKAARPGYSNHQQGIALDIEVGMDTYAYKTRRFTATYLWLAGDKELGGTKPGFAAEFGFDHVEGAKVNEPWHWTHLQQKIVGAQAYANATGIEVLAAQTAVSASLSNQSGVQRTTNREGHDEVMSRVRSSELTTALRQTMFTERATFSAYMSQQVSSTGAQLDAATLTLEQEPKAFDNESLLPLSYIFKSSRRMNKETPRVAVSSRLVTPAPSE